MLREIQMLKKQWTTLLFVTMVAIMGLLTQPAWAAPPQKKPVVTTGVATNVTTTTAVLNGTVNPKGGATTYQFKWGTTTSYGNTTTSTSAGSGTVAVPVSASISGLSASTTYHFQLTATNSAGTSLGADAVFTSSPPNTGSRIPPTLVTYGESSWGSGTSKATPSFTWQSGDKFLVLGTTTDNGTTLTTPATSGSGLSFSATTGTPTNTAGSNKVYGWTATASASSSGTITSTANAANAGIAAWEWRGSEGFGTPSISISTAKTVSLTRTKDESAVAAIIGEFSGGAVTGYTWTPAGAEDREASNPNSNYGVFAADWLDQNTAGTTSYGISGTTSTASHTKLAVEVFGQPGASNGCPEGSTTVSETESLNTKLSSNPAGVFCLLDGTHRDGNVTAVGTGDTVVGETPTGAIMDGTKELIGWVVDGSRWKVTGQTFTPYVDTASNDPSCNGNLPECSYVDLFRSGTRLQQVSSLASVTTGKWYFDTTNDVIYSGSDPTGVLMETSQYKWAIHGDGYAIKNMTVQRYAGGQDQAGLGIIDGPAVLAGGPALIDGLIAKNNHHTGLRISGSTTVAQNVSLLDNGRYGLVMGNGTFQDSEVARNNFYHFETTGSFSGPYDAGAMKAIATTDAVVQRNYFHDDYGNGIWFDIQNQGGRILDNVVENEKWDGIDWELGNDPYSGGTNTSTIIENNTVSGSGVCISAVATSKVEVRNNTCTLGTVQENTSTPIMGLAMFLDGRFTENNLNFHDNSVTWTTPAAGNSGYLAGFLGEPTIRPGTLVYQSNTYHVPTGIQGNSLWENNYGDAKTWTQWKALGYDTTGTLTT